MFDFNLTFDVTGIDAALARVDGIERQVKLNVAETLRWFGDTVTQEMIETHTFQNITFQLERSIGFTVESWQSDTIQVNVFAMAPYAQAVEEGTPNSRPYPFFWPVFYKWLPEFEKRLALAVESGYLGVAV